MAGKTYLIVFKYSRKEAALIIIVITAKYYNLFIWLSRIKFKL